MTLIWSLGDARAEQAHDDMMNWTPHMEEISIPTGH